MASKLKLTELLYPTSTTPAITINPDNTVTFGASTTTITNLSATSITDSGNLTFTGTGNRILGDFSNATNSTQVMFQTSTVNGNTRVNAIPNGTGTVARFAVNNSSDPNNAGVLSMGAESAQAVFVSGITGTGTYLPMTFYTGGSERVRVDTSGNLFVGTSAAIGASSAKFQVASSGSTAAIALARTDTATSATSISSVDAWGWDGTAYSVAGTINFRAAENWSSTNHGSDIQFRNVASGSGGALFESMRITSAGNVGIGTTSPGGLLHVNGTGAGTNSYNTQFTYSNPSGVVSYIRNTSSTGWSSIRFHNDADTRVGSIGSGNTATSVLSNAMYVSSQNNFPVLIATGTGATPSERLRVTPDGNVGIGTATPLTKLAIGDGSINDGNVPIQMNASASGIAYIGFNNNGAYGLLVGYDNSTGVNCARIRNIANTPITFSTNDVERVRIDTVGRVTSPYQTSFKAYTLGFSKTANAWEKITVASIEFNVGSAYNSANSRFTAPVAGYYLFTSGGWSSAASPDVRYATSFNKNGAGFSYLSGGSYSEVDSPMNGASEIIYLNANDYVELFGFSPIAATWGGGSHVFWWCGRLLG